VVWSDLAGADVDAVIAAQVGCFAEHARPREWKHYSYDSPGDLPARLRAAGLVPDPVEALLVTEIADLALAGPPPGVELVPIVDEQGVDALVRVHEQVFGGDHAPVGRAVLAGLAEQPRSVEAVLAVVEGPAVSGGRPAHPSAPGVRRARHHDALPTSRCTRFMSGRGRTRQEMRRGPCSAGNPDQERPRTDPFRSVTPSVC